MENQQEELTDAQIKEKKDEMMTFYKESMAYLEAQLDYEDKLMQIDEVRFKRFQISMQTAMMANAPDEEEEEEQRAAQVEKEEDQPGKRKAKKLRTA